MMEMGGSNMHIIQKIGVEIHTSNDHAAALSQRIGALMQNEIKMALEQLFNAGCSEDEIILAGKIELNLGVIAKDKFDTDFIEKLILHLTGKIAELQSIAIHEQTQAGLNTNKSGAGIPSPVIKNIKHAYADALVFYAENGYMPWWMGDTELTVEAMILHLTEHPQQRNITPIIEYLASSATHMHKFINRTGTVNMSRIIRAAAGMDEATFKNAEAFIVQLRRLAGNIVNESEFIPAFYQTYLAQKKGYDTSALQHLFSSFAVFISKWIIAHASQDQMANLLIDLKQFLSAEKTIAQNSTERKAVETIFTTLESAYLNPQQYKKRSPEIKGDDLHENHMQDITTKKSETKKPADLPDEAEGIFIGNAGLILFHPFITEWFKSLGYVDEEHHWIDDHQQRAVRILQLLVTGNACEEEHQLSLNKILCGLDPSGEIAYEITVTNEEKESAAVLLQAVIRHWAALRATSTEALQETFLQRTGKLFFQHESWKLKVEQKTVDILLEQLPWGISMVKLPWMEKLLRVEWNN